MGAAPALTEEMIAEIVENAAGEFFKVCRGAVPFAWPPCSGLSEEDSHQQLSTPIVEKVFHILGNAAAEVGHPVSEDQVIFATEKIEECCDAGFAAWKALYRRT